jgi:hypothetical protein
LHNRLLVYSLLDIALRLGVAPILLLLLLLPLLLLTQRLVIKQQEEHKDDSRRTSASVPTMDDEVALPILTTSGQRQMALCHPVHLQK